MISVPKNYTQPINIIADNNYWDSTNQNQISSYILDATDSIEYFHKISVASSLGAIPLDAPLDSKVLIEKKLAAERKAIADAELRAKLAATQKLSITCIKGKLTKKVTAVKPKCPSGYKKLA